MRWINCALLAAAGIFPASAYGQQIILCEDKQQAQPAQTPNKPYEGDKTWQTLVHTSHDDERTKEEKRSYLGVSASPPQHVLRKQLGLAPGMGLVVDFVVPDSPASKAGLQQYDVLQKLDDQLLINQQQLAVLVRSHKPGDEIKLAVFREGKLTILAAKLSEHELEPLSDETDSNEDISPFHRMIPEPRFRPITPGEHPMPGWGNFEGWGMFHGPASVTWLEDNKSYTLTADSNGHKTFIAKDKDGKIVEQGPVDTADQREKLSPGLREKLSRMQERFLGSQFQLSQPGNNQNPATEPHKENDKSAFAK